MLQFLLISHFLSPLAPSCSRTPCSVSELPVPSDLILYLFGGFPFIFPPAFDLFLNTSQQQKAVKENSNRKDEKFDIFLNSDILPVSSREKGQLIFFISGLRRMEPWLLKRTMSPKGTGATGLFSLAAGLWKWSWGAGKEWGILGLLQGSIRKNHYQIQNPGTPPPPELFINTVSPEGWQRPASQALWDGDLLKVQFYPIISQASWVTKDIEASKGSGGCYWRSCLIGFLLPEDFWGKERTQS